MNKQLPEDRQSRYSLVFIKKEREAQNDNRLIHIIQDYPSWFLILLGSNLGKEGKERTGDKERRKEEENLFCISLSHKRLSYT